MCIFSIYHEKNQGLDFSVYRTELKRIIIKYHKNCKIILKIGKIRLEGKKDIYLSYYRILYFCVFCLIVPSPNPKKNFWTLKKAFNCALPFKKIFLTSITQKPNFEFNSNMPLCCSVRSATLSPFRNFLPP